jgi:hypothetical protein
VALFERPEFLDSISEGPLLGQCGHGLLHRTENVVIGSQPEHIISFRLLDILRDFVVSDRLEFAVDRNS